PHEVEELGEAADRPLFVRIPALLGDDLKGVQVVLNPHVVCDSGGVTFERHVNENLISEPLELPLPMEPFDLGELGKAVELDVVLDELRTILVETVGNEDRNIVHPSVAWSGTQEYPGVLLLRLGHVDERFRPGTRTYQALLVHDQKCTTDALILGNVVVRVHLKAACKRPCDVPDTETDELLLPIQGVAFLCRSENVDVLRRFLLDVVRGCCQRLAGTHIPPQDLTARQHVDSFSLMRI